MGDDTLPSCAAAIAAMGEEEVRLAARAVAGALDGLDTGFAKAALDRLAEVEVGAVHDIRAEAVAEWLGDLLPHLVAARPDSGADRCRRRSGYGSNAVLQDAFHEPAPAHVEDDEPRSPVLAAEDDGEAVRREEAERASGPLGPEAVALLE